MDDVMEEVEVEVKAEPQPKSHPEPSPKPQQPKPKPTVCFWVGGVGLRVEAEILDQFMGGAHLLAASARTQWNDTIQVPVLADTIADPESVTHVHLDSSRDSMVHDPYLMHVILDFMCRRAKPSSNAEPMYTHAFPNGASDVVVLDQLQHYLFAGQVFRPCTAVLLNEAEAAAEAAEARPHIKPGVPSHPPFVPLAYQADLPVYSLGTSDTVHTSRYAEIALVGNYVKYHNAQHPTNAAKLQRTNVNEHFRLDVHEDLEDMCFDPLFWSMVRERCDGMPFSTEVLAHSKAMLPKYADLGNADDMSWQARRRRLMVCYSAEIYWMDRVFNDARRVLVERGVEVRVEAYNLQDVPGAQRDRVAGWDVGTGHRVVFRKQAEAELEEKLAKARKSTSTSPTTLKRRADLEAELHKLRNVTKWFVL